MFKHKAYNDCRSEKNAFYWKAVTDCMSKKEKMRHKERCFHIVRLKSKYHETDLKHCEILKPTDENIIEYITTVIKDKKIIKCLK